MDTELISEDELDCRLHKCDPVNRAAISNDCFRAAVAHMQRDIESSAPKEAPSKFADRAVLPRRWVTLGAATAAVAVASLVGVETLTGGGGAAGIPLAVSPAAAAQLNGIAQAAAAQPTPAAGQWQYLEIKDEGTATLSARDVTVAYTSTWTQQTWTAPIQGDTDSPFRKRDTNDGFSFLTPQDRATYLANKSAFGAGFDNGYLVQTMTNGVTQDKMFPSDGGPLPIWETTPPTSNPQTLIGEIWKQVVSELSHARRERTRDERAQAS